MATYTKTVDPNGGSNYASLNAWEAGEQTLYSSGDIAIADCKRTGATKDTTAVTIAGWTAGVIPRIIVNPAHRHEGKFADQQAGGNYVYIIQSSTTGIRLLDIQTPNTTIGSLILYQSGTGLSSNAPLTISTDATILAVICRYDGTSTSGTAGANVITNGSVVFRNSVFFGNHLHGLNFGSLADTCDIENCVIFGCRTNGILRTGGTVSATNTYSGSCGTACFSGTIGGDYNVSSDATAPGTNKATGKTAYTDYFVDPANGDFHLKNTSLALFGLSGTDLSGTFTTDIDGVTRSAPWDIGADQYVASGPTSVYSDLTITYDMFQTVASDLSVKWDLLNSVQSDLSLRFDILNSVFADLGIPWDVYASVNGDITIVFDIRNTVASDLQILWDSAGTVFSDLTVKWDLGDVGGRIRIIGSSFRRFIG